jgi:hypothetical protein
MSYLKQLSLSILKLSVTMLKLSVTIPNTVTVGSMGREDDDQFKIQTCLEFQFIWVGQQFNFLFGRYFQFTCWQEDRGPKSSEICEDSLDSYGGILYFVLSRLGDVKTGLQMSEQPLASDEYMTVRLVLTPLGLFSKVMLSRDRRLCNVISEVRETLRDDRLSGTMQSSR